VKRVTSVLCYLISVAVVRGDLVQFTQTSSPAGIVPVSSVDVERHSYQVTQYPPEHTDSQSFTHWTVGGVRQEATDGQAWLLPWFEITGNTTAVAHYVDTADDTNSDQIPDWQEHRYYGGLIGQGPGYNHDSDAFGHDEELDSGYPLNTPDELENGGVAMGFGSVARMHDPGSYKRIDVFSEPAQLIVSRVEWVANGENWNSGVPPETTADHRFQYWEVKGEDGQWRRQPETGPPDQEVSLTGITEHFEVRAVYLPIVYMDLLVRSEPEGLFPTEEQRVEEGFDWLSEAPPGTIGDATFAQWDIKGADGQWRRQPGTGYADERVHLTGVTEDYELRAVYITTDADTDADGLPDWQELKYFGSLAWTADDGDDELDADGLATVEELQIGYSPVVPDEIENGGVAMGMGMSTTVRDTSAYKRLEITSEPSGLLERTVDYVAPGSDRTTDTPDPTIGAYTFVQWLVMGEDGQWWRQPASGRAYTQVVMSDIQEDLVARALYLPTDDNTDGDGLADWQEFQYFGELTWTEQDGDDEIDCDGLTTQEELHAGYAPHVRDELENGGIAIGFGGSLTVRLTDAYKLVIFRSEPEHLFPTELSYVPTGSDMVSPVPVETIAGAQFVHWELKGGDEQWRRQPETGAAFLQLSLDDIQEDFEARAIYQPVDPSTKLVVIGSEPEGVIPTTVEYVSVGEDRATPVATTVGDQSFCFWKLRGVDGTWHRQPAGGSAYSQVVLPDISENLEARAVYVPTDENSDGDALADWQELQFFGSLDWDENDGAGEIDGDGLTIAEELALGYNPALVDEFENGGVAMGFSGMNRRGRFFLSQPFVLREGVLDSHFAGMPYHGAQERLSHLWEGVASEVADEELYPVLGDWDGDGDYELFVYQSNRVLEANENIGSSFVVNLADRSGLFSALDPELQLVPPELLGVSMADWDGDGDEELIWAYNLGDPLAARLLLLDSTGDFVAPVPANTSTVILPAVGADQYRAVALGDLTGDGLADLVAAVGDDTEASRLLVYERDPITGFGATPDESLDLGGLMSGREHLSLSVSRGANDSGRRRLYVATLHGQIFQMQYDAGSDDLSVERSDWAATEPGFAQVPRIAVADWDGDGDDDLVASFVDVDGDEFVADTGGGGGEAHKSIPFTSRLLRSNDPRLAPPFELTATNGAQSILLEWEPNREYQLDGYFIYRGLSATGPWTLIRALPTDQRRFVDRDGALLGGVDYYYQVTAITRVWSPGSPRPALYEGPPSVSNPARVESPLFALGEPALDPSDDIILPVNLLYGADVAGFELDLRIGYDESWLRPVSIENTPASKDLVFTDNLATASGEITIAGTAGSLRGTGAILLIRFEQIGSLPAPAPVPRGPLPGPGVPDGIFVLNVIRVRDLGNQLLVPSPQAEVEIWLVQMGLSADINLDGDIDQDDIPNLVSRIIQARSDPDSATSILPVADLNGTGTLDVGDIPLLYQRIAETAPPGGEPTAPEYEISTVETNGQAGTTMSVPLALNDATGLSAVYLQVNYDPNVLKFLNAERQAGTLGAQFDSVHGEDDGVIYVILYRDGSLAGGSGQLVDLEFEVNGGARPGMAADVVVADVGLASDSGARAWWNSTVDQGATRMWVTLSDRVDSDGDGISDYAEQLANGQFDYDPYDPIRNPFGRDTLFDSADSDGDGFVDGWEQRVGFDTFVINGRMADSDGDGVPDYHEQALGSDPLVPDRASVGLESRHVDGKDYPCLVFKRLRNVPADLGYLHEVSGDLIEWFSGAGQTEIVETRAFDGIYDEVISRDLTPVSGAAARYSRVRVEDE
jgi:hypothetical protein